MWVIFILQLSRIELICTKYWGMQILWKWITVQWGSNIKNIPSGIKFRCRVLYEQLSKFALHAICEQYYWDLSLAPYVHVTVNLYTFPICTYHFTCLCTRPPDSNRLRAPRAIPLSLWAFLSLSAPVRSLGRDLSVSFCVLSAPIQDFDREPSVSSVPAIIILSHTTFLFPQFAQTTTYTLPTLILQPNPTPPLHSNFPTFLAHGIWSSRIHAPPAPTALAEAQLCLTHTHSFARCIHVASQLMFAIMHTLPHHISFDLLHMPSIPV